MTTTAATVTVRAARVDDDLDALHAGLRSWYGQQLIRDMFATAGPAPTAMLVAEIEGVPVGYAHAVGHGFADGRRGLGHVYVVPEHRRRGVGTALWDAVLEVCTPERVPGVMFQTDDADPQVKEIALAHGLVLRGVHQESELDLATVEQHRALATARTGADVELRPLPEDCTEEQWHAFQAVYNRLMLDTPDVADGAEDMPYETLRSVLKEPWQVMCAWRGSTIVGFTAIAVRDETTRRLNTWLTAVDRDLRGHGLATALKVAQALALRDAGWRSIATQNMEGNDAILASNRRLGFVPGVALRDLTFDFPA